MIRQMLNFIFPPGMRVQYFVRGVLHTMGFPFFAVAIVQSCTYSGGEGKAKVNGLRGVGGGGGG